MATLVLLGAISSLAFSLAIFSSCRECCAVLHAFALETASTSRMLHCFMNRATTADIWVVAADLPPIQGCLV